MEIQNNCKEKICSHTILKRLSQKYDERIKIMSLSLLGILMGGSIMLFSLYNFYLFLQSWEAKFAYFFSLEFFYGVLYLLNTVILIIICFFINNNIQKKKLIIISAHIFNLLTFSIGTLYHFLLWKWAGGIYGGSPVLQCFIIYIVSYMFCENIYFDIFWLLSWVALVISAFIFDEFLSLDEVLFLLENKVNLSSFTAFIYAVGFITPVITVAITQVNKGMNRNFRKIITETKEALESKNFGIENFVKKIQENQQNLTDDNICVNALLENMTNIVKQTNRSLNLDGCTYDDTDEKKINGDESNNGDIFDFEDNDDASESAPSIKCQSYFNKNNYICLKFRKMKTMSGVLSFECDLHTLSNEEKMIEESLTLIHDFFKNIYKFMIDYCQNQNDFRLIHADTLGFTFKVFFRGPYNKLNSLIDLALDLKKKIEEFHIKEYVFPVITLLSLNDNAYGCVFDHIFKKEIVIKQKILSKIRDSFYQGKLYINIQKQVAIVTSKEILIKWKDKYIFSKISLDLKKVFSLASENDEENEYAFFIEQKKEESFNNDINGNIKKN